MLRRPPVLALVGLGLIAAGGCENQPDLKTALTLVPAITGYHEEGPMPDGQNKIVPSLTFQLKNASNLPLTNINLIVAFWRGPESESKQIRAIQSTALEPGAMTESFTVRSGFGFTSPYPSAQFFTRPEFLDFKIKIFAQRNGKTVLLGEVPVEHRVIPTARQSGLP